MLEGSIVRFDPDHSRKHPHGERIEIDTRNILFVCAGTFEGIEDIIRQRTAAANISSAAAHDDYRSIVAHNDLVQFGFLPEFAARFTCIAVLEPLTEENLIEIMTRRQKGVITDYQNHFEREGVELIFERTAIEAIARNAKAAGGGAWSLQYLVDQALRDAIFEVPREKRIRRCIVGVDAVGAIQTPLFLDEFGQPILLTPRVGR